MSLQILFMIFIGGLNVFVGLIPPHNHPALDALSFATASVLFVVAICRIIVENKNGN